ncbi:MAG TPA: YihY/virulence factor BrkB family protein [Polyangiaceae bacterium]|nr:YihY/virulence factor BrkB family protein [Polyangiaceae bacterium]
MTAQHTATARSGLSKLWHLANETLDQFSKDRGDLVAAALAFYTLLSLAPLIIIAVAIAGMVLGKGTAHEQLFALIHQTMGEDAAQTLDEWVREASRSGGVASTVGVVLTLLAASRFTGQLRNALNQIWNIDVSTTTGFKSTVKDYVKERAFSFGLVVASGPLLLAVVASRTLLTALSSGIFPESALKGVLLQIAHTLFSVVVVCGMSALVFRFVPATRLAWRAILAGAALTSVLFNIGNLLVGLYLGKASVAQAYGAAGSAIVVLLWLYFSAEMFLIGAEFTQVFATETERERTEGDEARPEQAET